MGQDEVNPTIYIISGGVGASGVQLVHTVLAQFPKDVVQVTTVGSVRQPEQIDEVLEQVQGKDALIVYTLVDPGLQAYLQQEAAVRQVEAFDLMNPVIAWVKRRTGAEPRVQPGLYRQLHREHFDRVTAIEFAMMHDDGKNPQGWPQAEAMLVGVSRTGKTPLSVYLAVLGWKVANYPLVPQLPVSERLFDLDPRRVFGLKVEAGQLLHYRLRRQEHLGAPGRSEYTSPQAVYEEGQAALKIFKRGGFTVIDMTDKTIEQGADEIIRYLSSHGSAAI